MKLIVMNSVLRLLMAKMFLGLWTCYEKIELFPPHGSKIIY